MTDQAPAGLEESLLEAGQGPSSRLLTAEVISTEALELLRGKAELAEDLIEEGRPDLSAAMDGNRHPPGHRDGSIARGFRFVDA